MRTIFLFLFLMVSLNTLAQDNTSDCKCCEEKYRQFDFWIGNWKVSDSAGVLLGYNEISPIEKGCGLLENWTGAKGTTGTSISFYNKYRDKWHQSWIDINGGVIIMDGKFKNGSMILLTEKKETQGGYVQNKTTWSPLGEGKLKHVWELTRDGGRTWQIVFEGYYSKRKK